MISMIGSFVRRRFDERRLIEVDVSDLLQRYGQRAAARALQYEAIGTPYLYEGRRHGHWRRVARCAAQRPKPVRGDTVFG